MPYIPVDIDKAVAKECKRRRYSERTCKSYLFCINKFLKWCGKDIGKISKKDVRLFLEELSDKGKAGSTLNVYHMALRFLFTQVLDKRMWINIRYSKTPEKLPEVLSKEETKKIFESIKNPKHSFMIMLMYSAGLRVSELLNLKVQDLNLDKGHGWVRKGKGNKDRLFILSKRLIPALKRMIDLQELQENDLIFKSNRDRKYSPRTIQEIIKKACKKAEIKRKIHPHTLRHSFATHLIENGYDVTNVQALLGHKSPETTLIYTHIASPSLIQTISPLDGL
jgi:integrase/recombinase XerD